MISHESKPFTFQYNDSTFTAYVRYYEGGDCDVELDGDGEFSPEVYEIAWAVAEAEGLMEPPDNAA